MLGQKTQVQVQICLWLWVWPWAGHGIFWNRQGFGVACRWEEFWQIWQGSAFKDWSAALLLQTGSVMTAKHMQSLAFYWGELLASKRVGDRGKKQDWNSIRCSQSLLPGAPHAFVSFNQYAIKLKSQINNFQWCWDQVFWGIGRVEAPGSASS